MRPSRAAAVPVPASPSLTPPATVATHPDWPSSSQRHLECYFILVGPEESGLQILSPHPTFYIYRLSVP